MISECFNPTCRARLHYLRDGRVIRVVHDDLDGFRIEHFWLCGACYHFYDFHFRKDGELSIVPKNGGGDTPDKPDIKWIEEPLVVESRH
jgi:hypothetical protein